MSHSGPGSSTHIGFLLTHCYSNAVSHSSVKKGVAKEVVPCKTCSVEIGEQSPIVCPPILLFIKILFVSDILGQS